ncbi:hypothetical protein H0H93_008944 [Arthromyces matolae]|nr:hypothetical protein H0H93_008944 [Arthromyces matolae]
MSAIRVLRQLTASSSRVMAVRQLSTVSHRTIPSLVSAPANARNFSVSARRLGEGSNDVALVQKLSEELAYENEAMAQLPEQPGFLTQFLKTQPWEIEDIPGNDEVIMTRTFGNEKLRVMFSVADVEGAEEDFESEEQPENEETEDDEDPLHTFPIRASISVTKTNGPGCINADMVAQEGGFTIENVSFYSDAKAGTDLTAEADWKRRGVYLGPQFETLDVNVQEEFERYFRERGVDENMALFIPEYAEHKEQKEYVHWLKNVKSSSANSSRSASPTLTASSGGLYVPVHKRTSKGSFSSDSSSLSSRTFSSGASFSSDSDSAILPPATPAFVYSRDTLMNLANSPLARMPQTQRDTLRSEIPEVMTNRKQRKAIDFYNHLNAVQGSPAALRVPSPTHSHSSKSSHDSKRRHHNNTHASSKRPVPV